MAAAYQSRDIVEDYLRHKLLHRGAEARRVRWWRRDEAVTSPPPSSSSPSSSSRSAMTSQPGLTGADPGRATPPLQVVLRCAGDELQCRYQDDLAAQVSALSPCGAERRRGLTAVRDELFSGGVNWGRILAMMELGGALCTEAVQRGEAWQVDDIADWMEESLESPPLRGWIEHNGGWDAFVLLYGEPSPPDCLWSVGTLVGVALLGAAVVTLGALLARR
ncbi:apoptosis regulator Bcl-2-like [Antennarius striatus]|uniref:apoptosis regulator Bcl-2-like n=1 Tax=Antennarius striatus TaxID=241820 RepID=UPI0035B12939